MRDLFACSVLLAVPLAAQAVTVSVAAANPLSVQASNGTAAVQTNMPAGALPPRGMLVATLPGAATTTASATWRSESASWGAWVDLGSSIDIASSPTNSGQVGSNEFVIQFTAASPAPAQLSVARYSLLSAGAPWPSVQVDFGNDGSIDVANLSVSASMPAPLFGMQPVTVRVVIEASLPGSGQSTTWVNVALTPANDVVRATVAAGCSGGGWPLALMPSFLDRGIDIYCWPGLAPPTVYVLGFHQQPVLLSSTSWAPCLLVPSPDILCSPPPGSLLHIPLPAAVRPADFWVQAVEMDGPDLRTTDAYRVSAY